MVDSGLLIMLELIIMWWWEGSRRWNKQTGWPEAQVDAETGAGNSASQTMRSVYLRSYRCTKWRGVEAGPDAEESNVLPRVGRV